MLKKTITYTDYDEEEVSEDHFFHLSQAEIVKLEMSYKGGLEAAFQKGISEEDGKTLVQIFEDILRTSYGRRSDNGKRFIKNEQIFEEFASTEAYSTLFMELLSDAGKAAEFVSGVLPAKLVAAATVKLAGADLKAVPDESSPENDPVSEPRKMTRAEFMDAPREDIVDLTLKISTGEIVIVDETTS